MSHSKKLEDLADGKAFINAKGAASYLGMSHSQLCKLAKHGQIRHCRFGSRYKFTPDDLEDFIEKSRVESTCHYHEEKEETAAIIQRGIASLRLVDSASSGTPVRSLRERLNALK